MPMKVEIDTPRNFLNLIPGDPLGESEPLVIGQARVNQFAEATGDHQFIHVDPDAAASTPFGGTIAHGYLTLSLVPYLLAQCLTVNEVIMGINGGVKELRFLSPVPVGSAIFANFTFGRAEEKKGKVWVTINVKIYVVGQERPSMDGSVVFIYTPLPKG